VLQFSGRFLGVLAKASTFEFQKISSMPVGGLALLIASGLINRVGTKYLNAAHAFPDSDHSTTTAISAAYPSVTILLCVLFFGEPLTLNKCLGVLFAMLSAYFFSRPS
jgi:drug/metabolite transporter (DMT)-like permease